MGLLGRNNIQLIEQWKKKQLQKGEHLETTLEMQKQLKATINEKENVTY